jgi:antibiotic biosynthesis monooxygenase (ABM) superfamily enzyme
MNIVFNPYMNGMPLPLRTLVLSLILVPLMAYFYIPFISKHFYSWLRK